MRISHDRIPGKVGTDDIIRLHVGIDSDGTPLIDLQKSDLFRGTIGPSHPVDKSRCDTGLDIAAIFVAQHVVPALFQR